MSDNHHPETMRPIPDGGLKDAMPSWLKRPPAWRAMPTAEERRERALPEPDTSTIDPATLLSVADLPQWLQAIAARGDVPVPEPDAIVEHAVEQVQAAQSAVQENELVPLHTSDDSDVSMLPQTAEPDIPTPIPAPALPRSSRALTYGLVAASLIILALIVVILFLL